MTEHEPVNLSPLDQQAIDALMEGGWDTDRVPGYLRERSVRVAGLLALLESLPEESTGDLLAARTLMAVEAQRRRDVRSQTRRASPGFGLGFGLSLGEMVAVAAMLLVSASILWPMLAQARGTARQMACQQNLAGAGVGFGSYAAATRGQMPSIQMRLGDPWWLIGRFDEEGNTQSNSAHLFLLSRLGYTPMDRLSCAENLHAPRDLTGPELAGLFDWPSGQAVSFSYQNQYSQSRSKLDRPHPIAVLADKNPFFVPGSYRFLHGLQHRDDAVSENHSVRRGQNVLLNDGRVRWLVTPRLDGDNIFHVGDMGLDNYTGTEGPRDEDDSFLVY